MWPIIAGGLGAAFGTGYVFSQLWKRNVHRWLPAYLRWQPEPFNPNQPLSLYFCFTDHYEPLWNGASGQTGVERVKRWVDEYPALVDPFRDSRGRPAQHSFFFPAEEYRPQYLDMLQQLCAGGYGDVEVHIHHDNDNPAHFQHTMKEFIERLESHGFLQGRDPRHKFGFIHGNWCLDNSRRDGRWCGLNNEISLLIKLGCYADFTFPSAPSETQPERVNCIYYCRDDAQKPRSYDSGPTRLARVGVVPAADELCLITGPLGLNYRNRKFGLIPRIENADVAGGGLIADAARVRDWVRLGARVLGAPNHVFIKVHTHGTQERVHSHVLGEHAREMYRALAALQNEGVNLYFVTAYEMWQKVRELELSVTRPSSIEQPALAGKAS